ncbi:MAG: NAD(P)-binding domain-containing protein [Actinomycetota bacterium]|jgi:6-phosphogluconate dehydrogenase|nr:NAD(P)-binding domain-containing protein [Actinomycetota bacterium]
MRFAIVGLGRMGLSLGKLAVKQGHQVVGWDPDDNARKAGDDRGLTTVAELEDLPGPGRPGRPSAGSGPVC